MREMCAYFSLNCLWRQDFALPSGGFLNCYWLIKNWLRYSSLKRSLKFLEEDWCLTLNTQCAAFTLRQRFLPFFYVKSSSNIRANDSFEICLSWGFQNTPNMLNLMKFWLRYLMLKTMPCPGICLSWGFWNCHWFWKLMKNWLRYSRLKARFNFRRSNKSWIEIKFWSGINCL